MCVTKKPPYIQKITFICFATPPYRAGFQYGLKPVMAEIYNLPTPHYYVVAVTKQRDNSSELIYLKRKSTCHTGVSKMFKEYVEIIG